MKKLQSSEELKNFMNKKGVVIFFFMDGCGHCEATRPAWEQLSRSGFPLEFAEVESSVVSPEFGIRGFPHFHLVDSKGRVKKVDGEKTSKSELANSLGLKRILFRPRNTRRGGRKSRRLSRRVRKVLHRT